MDGLTLGLLLLNAFINNLANTFTCFFHWVTQGDGIIIISFSFKSNCSYFFFCLTVDNISFSFNRASAING